MQKFSHTDRVRFNEISNQGHTRHRRNGALDNDLVKYVLTKVIECKPLVLPLDLPQVDLGPQNQAHLSDRH